jgi:hypothetical protein
VTVCIQDNVYTGIASNGLHNPSSRQCALTVYTRRRDSVSSQFTQASQHLTQSIVTTIYNRMILVVTVYARQYTQALYQKAYTIYRLDNVHLRFTQDVSTMCPISSLRHCILAGYTMCQEAVLQETWVPATTDKISSPYMYFQAGREEYSHTDIKADRGTRQKRRIGSTEQ